MSTTKPLAHEKRKGESALSDFAEYVEQQQNLRYPTAKTAAVATTETTDANAEHHEELDELFDNLDLADSAPRVPLKQLLLESDEDEDDENLKQLENLVSDRLEEGFGECVFEIGYENHGDSMNLTLDQWNHAYKTLQRAAMRVRADCDLLLTKNVGGDVEAASTSAGLVKDKSCSGKVLIRQTPATIEDVIETRIAVVGNGKSCIPSKYQIVDNCDIIGVIAVRHR
jgi:hypothetical protein